MKKTMKKRSKRLSTRDRVKQEKKKREHERKVRKDKRDNPDKYRKSKKDPGVPNLCPFKEDVLREAQEIRTNIAKQRDERRKKFKENRIMQGSLEKILQNAQEKSEAFNAKIAGMENNKITDRSAKAFYKEFQKVISTSDVVLQVLDARDPMGSRCTEVETSVISASKRLVLVLNKADLVPKENLTQWLTYLRREYPTIAFKASTQSQEKRLGYSKVSVAKCTDEDLQTSKCVGADTLMALLGNYCRNKDIKTSICVGIVGLPNVGKSSLINSLKRAKSCQVGSTPGVTKTMQEITLDSKIRLLDSPGLVFASGSMTDAAVALRNAIKVETLEDPITPVQAILSRSDKRQMMLRYNIANYDDVMQFLCLVARGMGKLKKGGIPNRESAARLVLQDWNSGKIKYYTHLPLENSPHVSAELLSSFSKEFDVEDMSFDKMEQEELNALPDVLTSDSMAVSSQGILQTVCKDDEPKITILNHSKKKKVSKEEKSSFQKTEGLLKMKKLSKLKEKKDRKTRMRSNKLSEELSQNMDAAFDGLTTTSVSDNNYDFDNDFKM